MGELQAKGVGRPRRREGCTGLQGASRAGENGVQTTGVMSTPPLSWDPGQVLRDLCAGLEKLFQIRDQREVRLEDGEEAVKR